jgi:hypothetical protein
MLLTANFQSLSMILATRISALHKIFLAAQFQSQSQIFASFANALTLRRHQIFGARGKFVMVPTPENQVVHGG